MSDKRSEYDVEVKGVEISPDPIARGQPATFSIAATTGTLVLHAFLIGFCYYTFSCIWCFLMQMGIGNLSFYLFIYLF